jgi:hypothetical protein
VHAHRFGIRLEGADADEVRFTEASRLLPSTASMQAGERGGVLCAVTRAVLMCMRADTSQPLPVLSVSRATAFPVIRCPHCAVVLDRAVLARLFREELQQLDEALTAAWLQAKGVIRCVRGAARAWQGPARSCRQHR